VTKSRPPARTRPGAFFLAGFSSSRYNAVREFNLFPSATNSVETEENFWEDFASKIPKKE
jgi:hypothetical protein